MRLAKLYILSIVIVLTFVSSLSASDHKILKYKGGILFSQITKNDYDNDLYINNQKIIKWSDSNKYYLVYGIPYATNYGYKELVVKNQSNNIIKNIHLDIVDKKYDIQRINVNKKFIEPDMATIEKIKKDSKELNKARGIWIDNNPDLFFISPVEGTVTGRFGTRRYYNGKEGRYHNGYDIAAPIGTTIISPSSGKVILIGDFFYNGKTIIIDHGRGLKSLMIHLDDILVQNDQKIKKGQIIGKVGSTGKSTGPHLHWSVLMNNAYIDPELLLNRQVIQDLILEGS